MRVLSWIVRVALGTALILHGLGNTVLPLRGLGVDSRGAASAVMAISSIAIAGFVVAGLAVLGVRPLRRLATPAALAAGASSIAGQLLLHDSDLAIGLMLSVALPALTWMTPAPSVTALGRRQRLSRVVGDAVGLAFLAWVAASAMLWPVHRSWGTTREEWRITLPGDHSPRTPAFELLHGVTIDAPPEAVWSWLVQLGQDRAGFYSYDVLERLFGVDIHNVAEIRPEWQARTAGDRVPATQYGYLGGVFGERPGWNVTLAEPNHALVLENWGAFVLIPDREGRTRFLIRSTISNRRIPVWAAGINFAAFQLPHFIMQRRMMLTIKALSERTVRSQA